jgi:hypothetical protein
LCPHCSLSALLRNNAYRFFELRFIRFSPMP